MLPKSNLETLVFLGKFILCYFKTLLLSEQWYRQTKGSLKHESPSVRLGFIFGPHHLLACNLGQGT